MKTHRVVTLLLLATFVALVQCDTSIEVDENGDEYEVKRFNIEGRQLNGGRRQCVVTRRKRSTAGRAAGDAMTATSLTPVTGVETHMTPEEGGVDEGQDGGMPQLIEGDQDGMFLGSLFVKNEKPEGEESTDKLGGSTEKPMKQGNKGHKQEHEEMQEEEEEEVPGVLGGDDAQYLSDLLSIQNGNPSNGQGVNDFGNIHLLGIQVAQPEESAEAVDHVPQSNLANYPSGPPQFLPLDFENEEEGLNYIEDVSPVSTTAIWSGGDDNEDLLDQYKPPKIPSKPSRRPATNRPKRPSKNKGNKKKNKNRRPNKKTTSPTRRPSTRPKKRRENNKKTSSKRKQTSSVRRKKPSSTSNRVGSNSFNTNRRKQLSDNSHRRVNSNFPKKNNKRKKNKKENINIKGPGSFTKTVTYTQTGDEGDDEQEVNCIYIHKNTAPTTARPFWNVFGRNANGGVGPRELQNYHGDFGLRKRINNIRFRE